MPTKMIPIWMEIGGCTAIITLRKKLEKTTENEQYHVLPCYKPCGTKQEMDRMVRQGSLERISIQPYEVPDKFPDYLQGMGGVGISLPHGSLLLATTSKKRRTKKEIKKSEYNNWKWQSMSFMPQHLSRIQTERSQPELDYCITSIISYTKQIMLKELYITRNSFHPMQKSILLIRHLMLFICVMRV